MEELRTGAVCEVRGSGDESWRVIDQRFDGHVQKYLLQSLSSGAIRWLFRHEIYEKYSSSYKEVNEFLQTVQNDFDESLFNDSFQQLIETLDETSNMKTEPGLDLYENKENIRFKPVTTTDIDALKNNNTEATTKKQTKWAVKMMKDWMMETGCPNTDFELMPVEELDVLLQHFFTALQSKTGKDYSKPTLVGIRAGINRHLTGIPYSRKLCIMKDREFMLSNQVLSGKIKTLKREGKDFSQHKDPISEADMNKLYACGVFNVDNPVSLQNKVMFEIILQFGRRGREGLQNLRKDSFTVCTDSDGNRYIKMSYNEADKTHHGIDSKESNKQPYMYESRGNKFCPVLSFEKYLSKLNQDCDRFFQKPLVKYEGKNIWYGNVPLGVNKINSFMANLSKEAGLSVRYTNHCIRATVTTDLNRAGFSSNSIMSVTGHRNVQSLNSYIKTSDSERKKLSSFLTYGNKTNETSFHKAHLSVSESLSENVPQSHSPSQPHENLGLSVQAMVNSNSVDVKCPNINTSTFSAFQLFSGNITSSTINVYQSFKQQQ